MIEHHAAELFAHLQKEQVLKGRMTLLPHGFGANSLILGQVDTISAHLTDEPFELQLAHFDYTTLVPSSSGFDFYGDTLFGVEAEIKEHPKRSHRLSGPWRVFFGSASPDFDSTVGSTSNFEARAWFFCGS